MYLVNVALEDQGIVGALRGAGGGYIRNGKGAGVEKHHSNCRSTVL